MSAATMLPPPPLDEEGLPDLSNYYRDEDDTRELPGQFFPPVIPASECLSLERSGVMVLRDRSARPDWETCDTVRPEESA